MPDDVFYDFIIICCCILQAVLVCLLWIYMYLFVRLRDFCLWNAIKVCILRSSKNQTKPSTIFIASSECGTKWIRIRIIVVWRVRAMREVGRLWDCEGGSAPTRCRTTSCEKVSASMCPFVSESSGKVSRRYQMDSKEWNGTAKMYAVSETQNGRSEEKRMNE